MECERCAVCCRLFMINLTEEEYKSGNYKTQFSSFGITQDFIEAELCGANIIAQKEDGACIYLKDNGCAINDKKPNSCRNFFCSSNNPNFKTMIEKIAKHKNKLK